jgi:hypothetical protein
MTGFVFYDLRPRPLSLTGEIMPGCYFRFYITQSTTNTPVYADGDLTTPLDNPLVSDGDGRFPTIYLDPTTVYRVQLYDAANVLQEDVDPVHALAAIQPGTVLMFFGTDVQRDAAYPPALFAVCDGTNGTPDMRDRFPIGVSATKTIGDTGGSEVTATEPAGAVAAGVTGSTVLTAAMGPLHNHRVYVRTSATLRGNTHGFGFANTAGIEGQVIDDAPYGYLDVAPQSGGNKLIEDSGSATPDGHNHTTPAVVDHIHDIAGGGLPPWLALWFLMRRF